MNSSKLHINDLPILEKLYLIGMTKLEAISIIHAEIYFLSYKDRKAIRDYVEYFGESYRDRKTNLIYQTKRLTYFQALSKNCT
ncbi:hypothetical protein [Aliivibrio fischeri]|uniref:hypothetical protein n=1 Tax=Aliivibrio fischeri TaxID=668 RepID=UPI0012DA095C|nr:hypothetical protein [Aliivibrio fischeri]MUJ39572.1 hypothetical protein [Aliivibrio fischeri]